MKRSTQSLAGTWQFQTDPDGQLSPQSLSLSQSITVPMPWQAALPELQKYSGYAWYQRDLDLDADSLSGEVLLTFGAVDYWCEVFINGTKAGEHEGGYTPFTLSIASLLKAGRNTLTVRVFDPMQTGAELQRHPAFPLEKSNGTAPFGPIDIPHGKQEWYINVGGIWQDVTLQIVPKTHIERVHVSGSMDGTVSIRVDLSGATDDTQIKAEILKDGQVVATQTSTSSSFTVKVDNPSLWYHYSPSLYTLQVSLEEIVTDGNEPLTTNDGEVITVEGDVVTKRFGFREVTIRDGMVILNNEPVYLVAALDQDFYLDTIYTPPSEEYLRDEFQKAKELGLNMLRCHIKPPDPLYLDLADEMGLLVWAEIPSWRTFYPKGTYHQDQLTIDSHLKKRVEDTLLGMIDRDFNHPSLIIWTIVNEDWGTALLLSKDDRDWIKYMYDRCKEVDPTRLCVDNSACPNSWGANVHVKSDLDDFHIYANIPDHASYFVNMATQLNERAVWTYTPHGDGERRGDEPVIVSEFGNWGLSSVAAYLDKDGNEPSWFELGPWWSGWDGEPGWMKGVLGRYNSFGLASVFGDYDSFTRASQWHQYYALKYQIEAMRRLSKIVGYVITELSDIYWECNGLMDFARRPKAYHDVFKTINTEDVVIPQLSRYVFWSDETPRVKVAVSRFSHKSWANSTLRVTWQGQTAEQVAPALDAGQVQEIGIQTLATAPVSETAIQPLVLEVTNQQGEVLAHNTQNLLVLPASAREAVYKGQLTVVEAPAPFDADTPNLGFTSAIQGLGYKTSALSGDSKLVVTTSPNGDVLQWVRDGGDLLYLCQSQSPFFWVQGRGGAYGGGWMTSWSWIKPGIHTRIDHAGLNPLSLPFLGIMPGHTLAGLPVDDAQYHGDFLAGQISGWINHPAVHTAQFLYGKGRVLMTTFAIADQLGKQPVATAMFHDLVDHLAMGHCKPVLRAHF